VTEMARKKVAVIGAGISGMAAAYFLSRKHEVWLLEREQRLGGHTHTHTVESSQGPIAVDTGFIVHNDVTYPNFVRLMAELGVDRGESDMSFGVSCRTTGMEWSSRGLRGIFAAPRNLVSAGHYRMLREMARFNREAASLLADPSNIDVTLGAYLDGNHFSQEFQQRYLYPMAAAVWSTSLDEMSDFPAFTLIRFFQNHGFLGFNTQHQWKTIPGGCSRYIEPLTNPYKNRIKLGARIARVVRSKEHTHVHFDDGASQAFDEVVFAVHGNQVLPMLTDATPDERRVLGAFETSRNFAYLHTDERLLPARPAAQASWNYTLERGSGSTAGVTVTYDMNRLQRLRVPERFCVSLNPNGQLNHKKVLREMVYFHPKYTLQSVRSQSEWNAISGKNRTHFCGAYWFYGFHEDGLNSALRVANAFGVTW
jgi:uncharacterized protein